MCVCIFALFFTLMPSSLILVFVFFKKKDEFEKKIKWPLNI